MNRGYAPRIERGVAWGIREAITEVFTDIADIALGQRSEDQIIWARHSELCNDALRRVVGCISRLTKIHNKSTDED